MTYFKAMEKQVFKFKQKYIRENKLKNYSKFLTFFAISGFSLLEVFFQILNKPNSEIIFAVVFLVFIFFSYTVFKIATRTNLSINSTIVVTDKYFEIPAHLNLNIPFNERIKKKIDRVYFRNISHSIPGP